MAYFDGIDDQNLTPEQEAESRRRMLGMLAGAGKTSVLGQPAQPPPTLQPEVNRLQPGTRGYDLSVSATNQPRIPTPKLSPVEAPPMGTPTFPGRPVLGQPPSQPSRPNTMPTREDFPAKPVPTWQKVLGVAAAPFVPALTAGLLGGPRREAEQKYQSATQEWERGQADQTRQAQIRNINSEIQSRENKPDPQDKAEGKTVVSGDLTYQWNPDTERYDIPVGPAKTKTGTFEEQEYQEWATVQKNAGKPSDRLTFEKTRATATQKPEKPQRTLVTVPQPDGSAKVIEATPGMTIPKGAKTVTEFGADSKVSPDEQRRADLANNLNENLDRLEEIVKRRPDLFGPVAGRKTSARQWLGTSDPDVAALDNIKEQVGLAMVGAHAMRNAQHAEKAANSILNAYKNQPEALLGDRGSINSARSSLKTFIGDVEGQRVQDKTTGNNQPIELERGPDGKLRPKNAQR